MTDQLQNDVSDLHPHLDELKSMLSEFIERARQDIGTVADPKAQALFETSAEVVTGLITAFEHYENKSEPAWQDRR
jgi:hypothetical protein